MTLHAPQIIFLVLTVLGLGIELARDGQPKSDRRYNFGLAVIVNGMFCALLWWGGFFG